MFEWIRALWDALREQQEERWKDQLSETETNKKVEAIRSGVMDTNVNMIHKKAELLETNAEFILAKIRKEENNEHTGSRKKGKGKGTSVGGRSSQGDS